VCNRQLYTVEGITGILQAWMEKNLPQLDATGLPLIADSGTKEADRGQGSIKALAATSLGNLLTQLSALDRNATGEDNPPGAGRGILLGEALPPVPAKLVNKIRKGDFIEMQDMLPDRWLFADEGEQSSRGNRRCTMDIRVWAQCFATYIRVIAESEPERVPDLLGYMINIIRASQDFVGSSWMTYDDTFRRQVAVSGSKSWGNYNSSLYSMCFTGKAQTLGRCNFCLSKDHNLRPCPLRTEESSIELPSQEHREFSQLPSEAWPQCRRFNEGRCKSTDCSYRHVCMNCGGRHPAIQCKQSGRGSRSRGRANRPQPY